MPNFLVMDRAQTPAGSPAKMLLYTNATPAQIGDTFGVQTLRDPGQSSTNDAIQFQGDLYGVAQDGVYKKDDPTSMTGAWTQQIAFASPTSTTVAIRSTGIHAMEINGVMSLVTTWTAGTSTSLWRWAKFDGTTWTQAASSQSGQATWNSYDAIQYNGLLYCVSTDGTSIQFGTYDPATNVFALIAKDPTLASNQSYSTFCVFDGRLFVATPHTNTNAAIYELGGGTFVLAADTGVVKPGGNAQYGKWPIFTDGTNMWILHPTDTGGQGWRCTEFDTALAQTNRDATLPTALRWVGAPGGAFPASLTRDQRMRVAYDMNTVVGTTDIYLYQQGRPPATWSMYKWNGGLSVMTSVDSGGDAYNSLASGLAFGERIFTVGELDIKITAREAVPGGEKNSFIVYGGGTGRKIKMHHLLKGAPPLLPCTFLAGTVTGGSATLNVGAKQIENVDADGVTVYTVVWNVTADGLSTADRVIRTPEALA